MNAVMTETASERRAVAAVREELERRLESGELTRETAAERLGLFTSGLNSLLMRAWSLPEAFRIAESLEIDFAGALVKS